MRILIAPDKFKGSLTASQACQAIKDGLLSVDPTLTITSLPLADGGEGTCDILTQFSGGKKIHARVLDPLFREIDSEYGLSQDGKTAFIEMAKASGLGLLRMDERNPLLTSTLGTGQLIKDALSIGAENIILGIGGSGTNDGGIGMASALGYEFLSENHKTLVPTGENLLQLREIRSGSVHPNILHTKFTILCDVDNPLCGTNGAAAIFGPQKGATTEAVKMLDAGLRNFQKVAEAALHIPLDFRGAGAAGGLGAGAKVFLHATMEKGFDFISNYTALDDAVKVADLVITGEGKIDLQTFSGKVVMGVARAAARFNKPCIAFAGKCDLSPDKIKELNLIDVIPLAGPEVVSQDSMNHAFNFLRDAARRHLAARISVL